MTRLRHLAVLLGVVLAGAACATTPSTLGPPSTLRGAPSRLHGLPE